MIQELLCGTSHRASMSVMSDLFTGLFTLRELSAIFVRPCTNFIDALKATNSRYEGKPLPEPKLVPIRRI